jgi:hypothetical protein
LYGRPAVLKLSLFSYPQIECYQKKT